MYLLKNQVMKGVFTKKSSNEGCIYLRVDRITVIQSLQAFAHKSMQNLPIPY